MQITFDTKPFATLEADALVTYLFEESDPVQGRISEIDTRAGAAEENRRQRRGPGKMLELR
jgi:hypothetical protein